MLGSTEHLIVRPIPRSGQRIGFIESAPFGGGYMESGFLGSFSMDLFTSHWFEIRNHYLSN